MFSFLFGFWEFPEFFVFIANSAKFIHVFDATVSLANRTSKFRPARAAVITFFHLIS